MSPPISISEAISQIHDGRLTSSELVERCLAQIRRYDDRVRAWVVVDEDGARRAARALDEEAARCDWRGPLHGVPLGIKDIVDVEGFPTRAGSPLRENHVARADAPLVAALRRAGAIILGKTVTVEFACFDPSPSRNPWDPKLEHTPGGSSSGSAVAVAMGMCPGAIGTQTGGSLVRPASFCGVATCKPTFGRVDREGIVPVSHHFDHAGPIARSVADLEIMLACMPRSHDFGPPPSEPMPSEPMPECSIPVRLGLIERFFMDEADEAIRQATETALEKLRRAGATIETVGLPDDLDFSEIPPMHRRIMAVEAAEYHRREFAASRRAYGPMITELLDEGLTIAAVDYAAALAHQRRFRRLVPTLLENVDALIVPSTDTTAPATLTTTGTLKFQAPWSYTGVPVVSIPCGLASDRMPAAVQLVGRYHQEASLFHVAQWCEHVLAFDDLPPLLA
jgi:aspartyl-tRNA(Asn)/glutamyl-tRNA(Gln) amidotransferase subunit A